MALFLTEDEGKQLNKHQIKIPDNIVKNLTAAKGKYGKYKKTDGYKRLNSMLDDDYNKRSDRKDRVHNGDKTLSFGDLKRIDHDIRHMPQTNNNLEYNMLGGDDTKNWVRDALNRERTAVRQNKQVPQVPKLEKQKVTQPDVRKPVKVGNSEVTLKESYDDDEYEHPYYEYINDYDEEYILGEFFNNPNGKQNWGVLINPEMYAKALREFTQYGKLIKFPEKYVYQWMGILMKNTAILRANTDLAGHSTYFPFDIVQDYAERIDGIELSDDFSECSEWLDEKGLYNWMVMPNGDFAISDYGIEPIEKIIAEYNKNLPAEKVLVLVNRILDVYHMRGDLSQIFIHGGSKTLSSISESIKKTKTIFINEEQLQKLYEYHNQLKLPFKNGQEVGYDYKENWENFVDFLEMIGKYGELPESQWGKNEIQYAIENSKEEAYWNFNEAGDGGENVYAEAFDDLIGGCGQIGCINTYLQHVPKEVVEEILKNSYAGARPSDILIDYHLMDSQPEENDVMYFLTDAGREEMVKYVMDVFVSQYENNGVPNSFLFDERGLIYVERMITIPKYNKDKFKHNGMNDFYRYLKRNYGGVGPYWTWRPGNSDAYCSNGYGEGDTHIILKGYVDPKDVNWVDTLLKNAYGLNYEQEIEINNGAIIEVDRIELDTADESVNGKSLINKPMLLPV